jgi:hypothetical protein
MRKDSVQTRSAPGSDVEGLPYYAGYARLAYQFALLVNIVNNIEEHEARVTAKTF